MKGFKKQELEEQGFMGRLFGSKPQQNAFAEINNILTEAKSAQELTKDAAAAIFKKWGCKFSDTNMDQRSAIYRKVADNAFSSAQSKDDPILNDRAHMAEILEIPENLCRLADNGAKKSAYFSRCRGLVTGEENLTIAAINELFGYDYEDGFDFRKQVFNDYFNGEFDRIADAKRFTPEDEQLLRDMCAKLDIPYEFKANIDNVLTKYRYLWNAENAPLGNVKVDFPLEEGEICHAAGQAALCEVKTVAKEDNYYQLTRKLRIDETISFKGEHIEHPQVMEETAVIIDTGYLFLTNSRIIYLSKKLAKQIRLDDLKTADLSTNIIEAHQNDGQSLSFKMQDDAAEVMFAILRRILKDRNQK